jgi:uncharacterized protein (TIGR02246 family)
MPTIDQLYEAWRDAIRRGDVDAALELLTPDYVLWPAGAPPIEGREPVRALFTVALERYRIDPTFECEEGIESGDLAFERGWDVQTVKPRDGGPPQTSRQRVFLVLRRGEDGRWRYARGMSQPGPEGAQA